MSKPLSVAVLANTGSETAGSETTRVVLATLLEELAARVWIETTSPVPGQAIRAADVVVVALSTDGGPTSSDLLDGLDATGYATTPVFVIAVGAEAATSDALARTRSGLADRRALVLPVTVSATPTDVTEGRVASASVLRDIRASVETAVPFLRVDRQLVSAVEGRARVASGARLIDVRSDAGRDSTGTVDGAEVVLKSDVEEFAHGLPRDTRLVVFCGSVRGSGPVAEQLANAGFTDVVHIDGGFGALRRAGAPTTAPRTPAAV